MSETSFYMPEHVLQILSRLSKRGINAYPVGGCVRDCCMGNVPTDYDIAAEADPQRLRDALEGFSVSLEGIEYGTVCVLWGGCPAVQITCCRRERGYSDCRRPDSVEYSENILEDLLRRDFTVNAMAYDTRRNEIIDPCGGLDDIRAGVLRCVGEPRLRFGEDALRILRALRFSSTLGFDIEGETDRAIVEMCERLTSLSGERVLSELKKLLCGKDVFRVLMKYSGVICTVIPELRASVGFDQHNPHHIYTVYEHIARTVSALPPDPALRLAMLFHDMAKPYVSTVDDKGIYHFKGHPDAGAEMADKVLLRLHADKALSDEVHFLIKYHDVRPPADKAGIHSYLVKVGYEGARRLLHIRRADLSAQSPAFHDGFGYIDRCEELTDELEREGAAVKVADLAVGGGDIIAEGVPSGPMVGKMLSRLLTEVAARTVLNEREALLCRCRELYSGDRAAFENCPV